MSDEDIPPAKKSPILAIVIVLGVANLAVLGVVAMKVMKQQPPAPAAAAEGGGEHGGGHGEKGGPGPPTVKAPTVVLDPFIVNLNEPGSSRYLKAAFEIELINAVAVEEVDRAKGKVRDELLRYLSSLSVADTLGEENKAKIQDQIRTRIDKLLGNDRVHKVYFTEFVIQ